MNHGTKARVIQLMFKIGNKVQHEVKNLIFQRSNYRGGTEEGGGGFVKLKVTYYLFVIYPLLNLMGVNSHQFKFRNDQTFAL